MKLSETFSSPASRMEGTWVFVDICDSTGMKSAGVEASWLPTTGWFYDIVVETISAGEAGTIVKFLGDGMMIAYSNDAATNAINDAVRIQEALEDGVEGRQVRVSCSIGIASGEAVTFETSPGHSDYIGEVVDRAQRLCSVASPQAVFVDTATTASAQMNKVHSRLGSVLHRQVGEYQGEVQKASLKGFVGPVAYQEILWSQQLFGLKSRALTATIDSAAAAPSVVSKLELASVSRTERGERGQRGRVFSWDESKHHGFLEAEDGERFYTDGRFILAEDGLRSDDVVYFLPRPAMIEGKARVAGAVMALGQEIDGVVVSVKEGFGFLRVVDSAGNQQDVFFSHAECESVPERHQRVAFVAGEGDRGIRAEEVEAIHAEERRAA